MKARLSTAQLEHLRALDPEDDYGHGKEDTRTYPKRTMESLVRRGLATGNKQDGWQITGRGARTSRRYVKRTGNGPERLKSLFRF